MIALKTSMTLPEWAAAPGASLRKHNEIVKEGLREEANLHLRNNIPRHFRQEARSRYKYAPRTTGYFKWKLRNRGKSQNITDEHGQKVYRTLAPNAHLDLIRTGDTAKRIGEGARITTTGQGNRISARLILRVPIPGGKTGRDMDAAAIARILASGKKIKFGKREIARAKQDVNRRTISEIEALAADEVQASATRIASRYAHKLNTAKSVKVK